MTTFVHCRGCGEKIHESAVTCPKCGAPQLAAPAGAAGSVSGSSTVLPASEYSAVPWYRRRWFIIFWVLMCAPVAGILALTGPLYYSHKGQTKMFPKAVKIVLYITSAAALFQLVMPRGSGSGFYVVAVCVVALGLGFKNHWPEK